MATRLTVGVIQLSVSDNPSVNLPVTQDLIADAAGQGAMLVVTPECTNLITSDRVWQKTVLRPEVQDPTLLALREQAAKAGIWLLIGSLCLSNDDPAEPRFVNRSFMIAPDGRIAARYDKIHMFDVTISESESYCESKAYKPGEQMVVAQGPAAVGLSICYDLRFPHLYRALAGSGAAVLAVPAAFNVTTGAAHWHVLLRARAIETGCFVLAPAQSGRHAVTSDEKARSRHSYGHSLIVNPWGEVMFDGEDTLGANPGMGIVELDLTEVNIARSRIPSIYYNQTF